jgi:hypothetical protein
MTVDAVRVAQLRNLRHVVERLGQPADRQLLYLRQLGLPDGIDELALEFDDVYRPLRWRLVASISPDDLLASLDAIGILLTQLSTGPPDNWTATELATSPTWEEVRKAALRALRNWPGP